MLSISSLILEKRVIIGSSHFLNDYIGKALFLLSKKYPIFQTVNIMHRSACYADAISGIDAFH